MRLSPSDLIPADQKVVVPFATRFGETWFAVHVRDCADGLVSVHPTRQEAEASIAGAVPHDLAGGDLCTDDGQGCCHVCGVSLENPCETCGGRGYHRSGCAELVA